MARPKNEDTNAFLGADDRLRRDNADSVRGNRENADADRINKDGTALSAEERRRLLRNEWVQEILPKPPNMPGFHTCWLTTTNPADSVSSRLALGYSLVRAEELPGFAENLSKIESGAFEGCISCREMILAKIDMQRHIDLMGIYHHDIPLEAEAMVRNKANEFGEKDSSGRPLGEAEGAFAEEIKKRQPIFY